LPFFIAAFWIGSWTNARTLPSDPKPGPPGR